MVRRFTPPYAQGKPAKPQRRGIADHMAGIGKQGQRSGPQAAGHLDHHEYNDNDECTDYAPFVGNTRGMAVGARTMMVVAMLLMPAGIGVIMHCEALPY